ncbi:S-layer homology domain-containing protein [Paenibacillus endoradicis]|uniref:S-layer homology domain-containing protein n=1 Tax=Paenibacillus endoradicis TaxID=2972487 RepID=UPI002158CB26|nr:S-layer homology domain-containing protein [Paenibacillus endoradicis]MCR8657281.1 S-layer homology domain-containing protein [Paenibacillus endoradicis]
MKKKMVKHLSTAVVAAMLVGSVPAFAMAAEVNGITATQETATSAIVHFVNSGDTSKLSSMATYVSEPKTYVKDGVTYLRLDVQQVYSVKITVDGKEGTKVAEYVKTVEGRNGSQEVTFFTFDYALNDATAIIKSQASYFVPGVFTETQVHDLFIVVGNDIDTAKAELATLIEQAKLESAPTAALQTALAAAEKANNYVTKKVDLEAALKALKAALNENPTDAQVYFVNESDASKISSMANYISNPKTYTKDGVTYLRLDVQQVYDVTVTVEEKAGAKVAEYVATVNGRTGPQEVTFFTLDYAIADENAVIKASASYMVPGVFTEPQSHGINIVIGSNVDAAKANLVKALAVANAVTNPSAALTTAIATATAANSYLNSNEKIVTATNALVEVVAKNVSFSDVTTHWAKDAINLAVAKSIVNGYTDGTFQPNKNITRAEFTKLIATALDLPVASNELTFKDAASIQEWAVPFVKQAVNAGIITGYQDETFRANNNITRAEMAVMVVKALNITELASADELTFKDSDSIPNYAKSYVATAVKLGLVTGLTKDTFGPNGQATRAEAVTIIVRAQ